MTAASRGDFVALAVEPEVFAGTPVWRDSASTAEVLFIGRSRGRNHESALDAVWPGAGRVLAEMRQVHSAVVLEGRPGACGEGDAMVSAVPGLALAVVTADCVPVLLAAEERVAAIHAGWRGLVAGVIEATLRQFDAPQRVTAWIGPAIGPCCYEVGVEVADPVVARSSAAVRVPGARGRPHLDLLLAAAIELERAGVGAIRFLSPCTACHPAVLESYRREGALAGRNRSLIRLRSDPPTRSD
jgi:polyphenol oxidase